jgi:hypothetical protein
MPLPQPTSATRILDSSRPVTPVQRGQDPGHQRQPRPGAERALDLGGRGRTEVIEAEAAAGAERLGQPAHGLLGRGGALEGPGCEPHAALLVGQQRRGLRGQLEDLSVGGLHQPSGGLAAQPFQQPPGCSPVLAASAPAVTGPAPASAR